MLPASRVTIFARLGLCVLVMAPTWVHPAEESEQRPAMTLQIAVERTLARHPDLAVFPARREQANARVAEAAMRPGPTLAAEIENVGGSGRLRGTESAELTLALSQVLELGGQRGRRIELAESELDLFETERAIAQWDTLAELARRFVALAALQSRQVLARQVVELAEATHAEVDRRVRAARSPVAEAHRAKAALARARVEQATVEAAHRSARQSLAAMWGAKDADFATVSANLLQWSTLEDDALWLSRLEASPLIRRFVSEARVRDAEVQLARARAGGSWTVSVGVRRLRETDEDALVAGISVPLFAARQARPALAQALARRELSERERMAASWSAQTTLLALLSEWRQSVAEAKALQSEIIPALEAALEATDYAWRRGRYSYLELTEAQSELARSQLALIDVSARSHVLRVEIERLTGTSTTAGSDSSGVSP